MFCYNRRVDSLVFCYNTNNLESLNKCLSLNETVCGISSEEYDEDENNILKYLVSIPSTFENGDPDLEANLISENLNAQHIGIDFEFKQSMLLFEQLVQDLIVKKTRKTSSSSLQDSMDQQNDEMISVPEASNKLSLLCKLKRMIER